MKKLIPSIKSSGPMSKTVQKIFDLFVVPFIKVKGVDEASEEKLLNELFHTDTRTFIPIRAVAAFELPGVVLQGNRRIPGIKKGRSVKEGDTLLLRRDEVTNHVDVTRMHFELKEDYVFEITIAELGYILDRCEYV